MVPDMVPLVKLCFNQLDIHVLPGQRKPGIDVQKQQSQPFFSVPSVKNRKLMGFVFICTLW